MTPEEEFLEKAGSPKTQEEWVAYWKSVWVHGGHGAESFRPELTPTLVPKPDPQAACWDSLPEQEAWKAKLGTEPPPETHGLRQSPYGVLLTRIQQQEDEIKKLKEVLELTRNKMNELAARFL